MEDLFLPDADTDFPIVPDVPELTEFSFQPEIFPPLPEMKALPEMFLKETVKPEVEDSCVLQAKFQGYLLETAPLCEMAFETNQSFSQQEATPVRTATPLRHPPSHHPQTVLNSQAMNTRAGWEDLSGGSDYQSSGGWSSPERSELEGSDEEKMLETVKQYQLQDDSIAAMTTEDFQKVVGHRLSKNEELEFKKLRRKMKNKMSAALSRQKKREHMSVVENKVQVITRRNNELALKVGRLEKENQELKREVTHYRTLYEKLQDGGEIIAKGLTKKKAVGTYLLMLVLSFGLILDPLGAGEELSAEVAAAAHTAPTSRKLLTLADDLNLSALSPFYLQATGGEFNDDLRSVCASQAHVVSDLTAELRALCDNLTLHQPLPASENLSNTPGLATPAQYFDFDIVTPQHDR